MKPIPVSAVVEIIGGELVKGSADLLIEYGAYRLKQIKHKRTMFFTNTKIVNWQSLSAFFPLVIVTEWTYRLREIPDGVTVVKVDDMTNAYWQFVEHYRSQFKIPIVAITGTAGKTTTKEMVKHILSSEYEVVATHLSNNSRTELLQNLLRISETTQAAIFETAVGAPGDVLGAGRYFQPSIGVITNIGSHHLNYCKTQEGYIEAKAEMLQIVGKGTLIINADDTNTKKVNLRGFQGKVIRIGKHKADFLVSSITYTERGMRFILHHEGKQYVVKMPGHGEHQVYNALAALAVVHEVGMPLARAITQLATFRKLNKQLQILKGINGSMLIDDTWSITTTSLDAALHVLNKLGHGKKKIAVIGTITDLGAWGYNIHKQAGEIIYKHGVDVLITIGEHASIMASKAQQLGLDAEIYSFKNNMLARRLLKKIVDHNTVILIKGDMYSDAIHELAAQLRRRREELA
ncbi:Mur ligase family protein [Metasolibacillus meyeri]|uniref:Mur ligase family protein n=1 Tax=Metasolibacillus meyeri TaxID=1071052 RepID=UPI000D30DA3F|nr:Mur ligase family protein [Metasolibacillus meyeri]